MKKFMKQQSGKITISKEKLRAAIYEAGGKFYTLNELGKIIRKLEAKGKLCVNRKNGYSNSYKWLKSS